MLLRRKIVLSMLVIIPVLFIFIVQLTSSKDIVYFQLGIGGDNNSIKEVQGNLILVFVTMATIAFLTSFLALNVTQQYNNINRRLVLCGYQPSEIILSGLIVILSMIFIVVIPIGLCMSFFFHPMYRVSMIFGFLLVALIYGCYGMLIGSIIKGELEGTLLIILLANIDVGWLQNPVFYAQARNKGLIELLPAYYPSQIALASAFTNYSVINAILMSAAYILVFIVPALFIFYHSMRIKSSKH
jgi:hypothetical protein